MLGIVDWRSCVPNYTTFRSYLKSFFLVKNYQNPGSLAIYGEEAQKAIQNMLGLYWGQFKEWLGAQLLEHSERLCRFKGVLWVEGGPFGAERRLVLQGLFGHVETHDGGAWGEAPRRSRLIFIGRVQGMEDALREGAAACAKPKPAPAPVRRKKQFFSSSGK